MMAKNYYMGYVIGCCISLAFLGCESSDSNMVTVSHDEVEVLTESELYQMQIDSTNVEKNSQDFDQFDAYDREEEGRNQSIAKDKNHKDDPNVRNVSDRSERQFNN